MQAPGRRTLQGRPRWQRKVRSSRHPAGTARHTALAACRSAGAARRDLADRCATASAGYTRTVAIGHAAANATDPTRATRSTHAAAAGGTSTSPASAGPSSTTAVAASAAGQAAIERISAASGVASRSSQAVEAPAAQASGRPRTAAHQGPAALPAGAKAQTRAS